MPGSDPFPLTFELSGGNGKKRNLSWGLGEECVEIPLSSLLPQKLCPHRAGALCSLLFPQAGPAVGSPALESAGWPSLGIVVSHSVMVLILPLGK